jgi:hypothetical protein
MIKNVIASIVIVAALVGGEFALHNLDTGNGARTDKEISAKAASD